jgi:hypothetical protein
MSVFVLFGQGSARQPMAADHFSHPAKLSAPSLPDAGGILPRIR